MRLVSSRRRASYWALAAVAVGTLISPFVAVADRPDPYAALNSSWDRFGSVYRRVVENYYSPVDHEIAMRAAIDGMLRELDSYSQYFDEESLRQLRQDTTGRFAGLGITVGIKDQYPVVIAPIEGTPADHAGLLPGDLIVAIEGRDTFGLTLEEVVAELRGEPGSSVRITIDRLGVAANWQVLIVREMITIRSVAVAEEISPGIGYISMRQTRFSEDTSTEVEQALERLFASGVGGLIIDLRGNPGGLLSQAAEVADLFLPRGAPIVSVRERSGRRQETKVSERRPPARDTPLVVLIDGGSASAAEIVAGAVQDNDRGLVVGTTSFGKGSVQTIFDLREQDRAALKLTTALYYTPSGRSIHKESLNTPGGQLLQVPFGDIRLPAGMLLSILLTSADTETASDKLRARFDLDETAARRVLATPLGELVGRAPQRQDDAASKEEEAYLTDGGRSVYGGGGITPDLVIEQDMPPPYVQELRRHRVFFDFVVEYVGDAAANSGAAANNDAAADNGAAANKDAATSVDVDDDMIAAFRAFVPRSAATAARRRQLHDELDGLRILAADSGWDGAITARIDSLAAAVDRQADLGVQSPEAEPYIRRDLQRELALRLQGRRASLLVNLDADSQVTAALGLLRDPDRYTKLLSRKD